jgi:hypothetical protein
MSAKCADQQTHWLVIKPHSAKTACGIPVICHYPMSQTALAANSDTELRCVTEPSNKIDCPKCYTAAKDE